MPNKRISKTSNQRGASLLAVLVAAVVLVVIGGAAAGVVTVNWRVAQHAFTRADLNQYAEAVAGKLAAVRFSGRRTGLFVANDRGVFIDTLEASGKTFRYTARSAVELGRIRVHVIVHPITPARGEYAQGSASY